MLASLLITLRCKQALDKLVSNIDNVDVTIFTNSLTFCKLLVVIRGEHCSHTTNTRFSQKTVPNAILTGKPTKVHNIATLDISVSMFKLLEQSLRHNSQFNILVYFEYFFARLFFTVLTTLRTYFGLRLGGRIKAPTEPRAPLDDLDTTYE